MPSTAGSGHLYSNHSEFDSRKLAVDMKALNSTREELLHPSTTLISCPVCKTVTLLREPRILETIICTFECASGIGTRTYFAMPQIILKDALALDSINKTALSRRMNEVAELAMRSNADVSN